MAPKNNFKIFYALSFAWQLGFLIVVSIGGFLLIGFFLDKKLQTSPLFLLIGFFVGLTVTFYEIYQSVMPIIKEEDNKKDKEKNNA